MKFNKKKEKKKKVPSHEGVRTQESSTQAVKVFYFGSGFLNEALRNPAK